MAHVPEALEMYVCENCQVVHAGTPIHESGGEHRFEAPDVCGACGETTFVRDENWATHHE